ncbi:MAG: RagB/SusD family nutrient uptake outer membrane protein [Candidatus Pedobacter colombiensis]|uniref:RagB/SusD family nutrient uptake outer membrane protein n=1 Tax=Candidatus Pedobacter colombiensis TaxID=3121371 RepID=A0AAJ6B8I9_9SPHI|nr:RagB/SusD family nutrient uptake outer membrane protein [Pedobacter sp.]WEK20566.1 MAG: RagB/SusD family nutrient uptake outer membrane protein [Pedobacter sp.]
MKKLLYINILAVLLITFSSCKKLLDIKPVNSMKPVSVKDYESLLIGGYPRNDYFFKTELMTDNVYVNLNSGYQPEKANEPWFIWASSMQIDGVKTDPYWGELYKSVFYANTILDNFSMRTPLPEEKELYEKVKGEAYALRAYSYFYLVNWYADTYAPENLQALGVPMPLTAVDVNVNTTNNVRQPLSVVWKQIVSDLEEASKLLAGKPATTRFRFNSNTLDLFKARVALFMGDYQTAIASATSVMDASPLTDLNGIQDYIDSEGNQYAFTYDFGFIDTDYNKEILFFTGGKANNNIFYYSAYPFKPSEELLTLTKRYGYLTDYRQYIFESWGVPNTTDGITKGPTMYCMYATQQRDSYYIGMKASEAYVTRAEAYARTNQGKLAIADLNLVLQKRIKKANYVPLKMADFADNNAILKRVLEERRVETAFDAGLRWLDLRRLGKPEIQHAYKNGVIYTLKKNDPRYLLQIPPSEINNSPEMPLNPR